MTILSLYSTIIVLILRKNGYINITLQNIQLNLHTMINIWISENATNDIHRYTMYYYQYFSRVSISCKGFLFDGNLSTG